MANTVQRCTNISGGVATWVPVYDAAADDTKYVNAGGDTMVGMLTLPGTFPSVGEHATHKTYVDGQRDTRVAKAGDIMTGALNLNSSVGLAINFRNLAGSVTLGTLSNTNTTFDLNSGSTSIPINLKINGTTKFAVAQSTITASNHITLPASDPGANQAARKEYVDTRVLRAGDTMTGMLTVNFSSYVDGESIKLISGTTENAYLSFYSASTLKGWVGKDTAGDINLKALDTAKVLLSAPALVQTSVGAMTTNVDSTGLYLSTLPASLVVGANEASGPRHRLFHDGGGTAYYDFDGSTAGAGSLQFRSNGTQNILRLGAGIYAEKDLFLTGAPINFVVGGSDPSAGPRHRLHVVASGELVYYDFDGISATGLGQLQFRCGSVPGAITNVFRLSQGAAFVNGTLTTTTLTVNGDFTVNGGTSDSVSLAAGAAGIGISAAGHLAFVGASPSGVMDFTTGGTHRVRLDASGNFLYNKTGSSEANPGVEIRPTNTVFATRNDNAPTYVANNATNISGVAFISCHIASGEIGKIARVTNTSAIQFVNISDERWKGNIRDIDDDEALDFVERLRPRAYQERLGKNGLFSAKGKPSGPVIHGFVSQELYEVQPMAVVPPENDDEPWMSGTAVLIPDIVAAVRALTHKVRALERAS